MGHHTSLSSDKKHPPASKNSVTLIPQPDSGEPKQNAAISANARTDSASIPTPASPQLKIDQEPPRSRKKSKRKGGDGSTQKTNPPKENHKPVSRKPQPRTPKPQSIPVRKDTLKDVCTAQPKIRSNIFTVGIPETHFDALPQRKSYRATFNPRPRRSMIQWPVYLCLKCRQEGHETKKCPRKANLEPIDWTTARSIHSWDITENSDAPTGTLCTRCQELKINLSYAGNPIEKQWEYYHKYKDFKSLTRWVALGPAVSIVYQKGCTMCRLLFSITRYPQDSNKEMILTDTTSNRRLGASKYELNNEFSACGYVTTEPTEFNWEYFTQKDENSSDNAMAAISYLSEDYKRCYGEQLSLGARLVDPAHINESIIYGWLERCQQLHGPVCRPEYWDELRHIRLVDVVSRQIVPYPADHPCDYIALSYVWGNVIQQSYTLGSRVERVPQTIEDAMAVVKTLGKKYLWVDSLTIDQSDNSHKEAQIKLMSIIYRGAWATIVSLSGRSASSGLPRVNASDKTFSDVVFPQPCANFRGVRIVSTMPTLAQQMKLSRWATRAWTLQEALLSPRCLYFTQHQVYFQCNTHQCCEALDDANSHIHNAKITEPSDFGTGTLRSDFLQPSTLDSEEKERDEDDTCVEKRPGLKKYCELLGLYAVREMTQSADKLNAFSGILQALESRYFNEHGFHHGLPISGLPFSLLWQGEGPIARQNNFPSWSWAGWKTTSIDASPPLIYIELGFQPFLRIFKLENDSQVQIHYTSPTEDPDAEERLGLISPDPLWPLAKQDAKESVFPAIIAPDVNVSSLLFVEGIILSFICPIPPIGAEGGTRSGFGRDWKIDFIDFKFGETKCTFRYRLELANTLRQRAGQPQDFLVLARDLYAESLTYWLLLLDEKDGIKYRNDVILLGVPYHKNHCVKHANPRRTRIVLG